MPMYWLMRSCLSLLKKSTLMPAMPQPVVKGQGLLQEPVSLLKPPLEHCHAAQVSEHDGLACAIAD